MRTGGGLVRSLAVVGVTAICGGATVASGPDVRLCQLYDLREPSVTNGGGRDTASGTVGIGAATRAQNVGADLDPGNPSDVSGNLNWYSSPDSRHPFIALNMYRLLNGRFEQIGINFPKHGFYATSDNDCNDPRGCSSTNGSTLGVGCDDLYSATLNTTQSYLGPRFEINPWTGGWDYNTSIFSGSPPITNKAERRLRVKESDLTTFTAASNPTGVKYFYEAYYVAADDIDLWNNAAWKPVSAISFPGGGATPRWTFTSTGLSTAPTQGFAIDAWTTHEGARQTLIAQELPIVENVVQNPVEGWSPDGRAIIASKVTPNPDGSFHYEYAVMNIDMDRQIGSFSVPVPCGVCIENIGWSGVMHWTEPTNEVGGKAIDNSPWVGTRGADAVAWSTPAVDSMQPSNPMRWGMLFNFRFDASTPSEDGLATVGLFKEPPEGGPVSIAGLTDVPRAAPTCPGDADCNCFVNFGDIIQILSAFGTVYTRGGGLGDPNGDGTVDFEDVLYTLSNFNEDCSS